MPDTDCDSAKAIHSAARRYCETQYRYWAQRYNELIEAGGERCGSSFTPDALRIFPRYNLLNAVLAEVERLDPDKLPDLEETRELLLTAGIGAQDAFTRTPIGEIDAAAMGEERDAFCAYVRRLDANDARRTAPLPYRRILGAGEAESLWTRLSDKWSINAGYWYPLAPLEMAEVEAFQSHAFRNAMGSEFLPRILRERGASRIWELRESGLAYQIDVLLLDPVYRGDERYWSSEQMDWIIYASHEDSVTVGGWILDEVRKRWEDWRKHVWGGQ